MKLVFILSISVFLMLPLSVKADKVADEVIVVTKGGRMERGKVGKKEGYVIVQNKEVRGKLLKKGAWLRATCRDNLDRTKEHSGIYFLNDMWKEGSGFFIAVKYRKHDYVSFVYVGKEYKRCWRVVKS